MTVDHYALISAVASFLATVFSWITIGTGNWKWYIPTVLFAAVALGSAAIGFSLI